MTTPAHETAVEIALLRSEVGRIADVVEKVIGDHETRIRNLEGDQLRTNGVLKLIGWLGAPAAAGVVLVLSKHV